MILRRVIEHFRKQEWTAIFLDFIIVVLGVFVGMQVQEWSKQRDDRHREAQIIADMLGDLEIDRAQYANGMAYDQRGVAAASASMQGAGLAPVEFDFRALNTTVIDYEFDVAALPEYPADQLDRLWTDVVIRNFPATSTSTYDAMVGAGDIRIIENRDIVRAIQTYRNRTVSVALQNQKLQSIRENTLQTGASYGLATFSAMPAADYFRLVAGNPGLSAAIRDLATFSIFHYGELRDADAHAAELQDRLRRYLEEAK
jgi:hypothetical protein